MTVHSAHVTFKVGFYISYSIPKASCKNERDNEDLKSFVLSDISTALKLLLFQAFPETGSVNKGSDQ